MDAPDPEPRLGVADAHGIIAAVAGLGVFIASCACFIDPPPGERMFPWVMALGAVAVWSGLFGVLVPGSRSSRALSALGLCAVLVAIATMCAMASAGRNPF